MNVRWKLSERISVVLQHLGTWSTKGWSRCFVSTYKYLSIYDSYSCCSTPSFSTCLIFKHALACFVFLILSWWEPKWGSNMMGLSSQTWGKVMTSVHHRSVTAALLGWNANMRPSPAAHAQPGTANSRWQAPEGLRGWADTHCSLPLLLFELLPESEELLVLAWNKINGRVLQQCSKDEEEAHGHPDVDGFHVGHLWGRGNEISQVT